MNPDETVVLFLTLLLCLDDDDTDYGPYLTRMALQTNTEVGRGRVKNKGRISYGHTSVYEKWKNSSSRICQQLLHISFQELETIINDMRKYEMTLLKECKTKCIGFEDCLLMTLYWMIHYPRYAVLSSEFGVSEFVVSMTIQATLPYLVEHFVSFIPNTRVSDHTSSLSSRIMNVIDGTAHFTQKPMSHQHLWYRRDKGSHWIRTQLLVDYEKNIMAVSTNYQAIFLMQRAPGTTNCFHPSATQMGNSLLWAIQGFKM